MQGIILVFITFTVKADIIEIEPGELVNSLEKHKNSVVQFTSPDKNCGHCIGADKAFDQFANNITEEFSFLRVQWSPWHATPQAISKLFRIVPLPMHVCYRDGKVVNKLMGSIKTTKSRVIQRFKKACFKN
jgi:thioredoxin-like negative regulator of GroEL